MQHFWACSYPPGWATLCVVRGSGAEAGTPVQVNFFDPDGELFNEVVLRLTEAPLITLELDHMLEPCKLESGLRHARVRVELPPGYAALVRHHDRERAVLAEPAPEAPLVVPVVTGPQRSTLVALMSDAAGEAAQVRVKLFVRNRTPEIVAAVPPNGVRLLRIESEFREVLEALGEKAGAEPLRGYLRISPRNGERVFCRIAELSERREEGAYLATVA